jgi:hypothetical protein
LRLFGRLRRRSTAAVVAVLASGLVPLVTPAVTPTAAAATQPNGYWLVATDGGIFSFGDAKFFGSTGAIKLNQPIVGMAATPTGNGYWMVATDGGIFSFGDAKFFGSTGNIKLNKPIVGMAPTPTGNGYWMVATDGGIFSFGDAKFFGSTGAINLNQPITGMAPTNSGAGYWMTATDGGVFNYGDGPFFGAAPSVPTSGPRQVVAMVPSATGGGYWQASAAGEVLAFGDAPDLGRASNLSRPIVGMTAMPKTAGTNSGGPNPTGPGATTPSSTPPTTTAPPPISGSQRFSSTARSTWGTVADPIRAGYSQEVAAVVEAGGRAFVGGSFTNIKPAGGSPASPARQFLVALDVASGAPAAGAFNVNAMPDGPVYALAVSGNRLYVGGTFNGVGGHAIKRLAAINLDTGLWDSTFNPPTPNAFVKTMAIAGNRLYIGGSFVTLQTPAGPVSRPGVAALDLATGALIDTFVPPVNYGGRFENHTGSKVEDVPPAYNPGNVQTIAVTHDGLTVMVGGSFLHFGTTKDADPKYDHSGLIALDAMTGALTPWQPVSHRPVFALSIWPGDGKTVFAAAGGAGGELKAYVPGGKTSARWTAHVDGDAVGVAATRERVYLAGHYDHYVPNAKDPCLQLAPQPPDGHLGVSCPDGVAHRHLAAFDATNGNVDPSFTAQADTNEGPGFAYIGADNLYIGGNFTDVANRPLALNESYPGPYRNQPGLSVYPAI